MAYLTWNNQQDAQDSLNAVTAVYGCPYEIDNGYRMNQWDVVTKSNVGNQWGFNDPEVRPGKEKGQLDAALAGGHAKTDNKPDDWNRPENQGGGA